MSGSGPGWRQEPGTPSESFWGMIEAQVIKPSFAALTSALAESWIETRTSGTQIYALIWDASIASGSLAYYTKMLAHKMRQFFWEYLKINVFFQIEFLRWKNYLCNFPVFSHHLSCVGLLLLWDWQVYTGQCCAITTH